MYRKAIDNKSHEPYQPSRVLTTDPHQYPRSCGSRWTANTESLERPETNWPETGRKMQRLPRKHVACFVMCYSQTPVANKLPWVNWERTEAWRSDKPQTSSVPCSLPVHFHAGWQLPLGREPLGRMRAANDSKWKSSLTKWPRRPQGGKTTTNSFTRML